ncbi:hypothetical protein K7432_011971 [Basidiobolus ranarum]|uniref:Uncharacterized protein n=1 Tax=Basidiobolus ranarum TaxID=34480 RepID=A0ABR2WLJ6_9FUNG
MKFLLSSILLTTLVLSSVEAADNQSCWRACNGDASCLTQCYSQLLGIGECKAKCDFTNPDKGRQCIKSCVEDHVLDKPNITPSPTATQTEQNHHFNNGQENCWRSCNGKKQCLEKCDEQVRGIGECKANCDFTNPTNGVRCIQKCRDDHIFQGLVETATPTGSEATSVSTSTNSEATSVVTSKAEKTSTSAPNSSNATNISSLVVMVAIIVATLNTIHT